MRVTASVVFYNSDQKMFCKTVKCLLDSTVVNEIYILNARDDNKLLSYLFENEAKINIMKIVNKGYGGNHNQLLFDKSFCSDYHFIVNPDIYFSDCVTEKILKIMIDKKASLAVPGICNPDGTDQYPAKILPTPFSLIIRRFFPFLNLLFNSRYEIKSCKMDKIYSIPFLSGSFMLVNCHDFIELKGFDERFFMYCEDLDLSRRFFIYKKSIFVPNVKIFHNHEKSSYKNIKMLILHINSAVKYFNKYGWIFDSERKNINSSVLKEVQK